MQRTRIISTGSFLPEFERSNSSLAATLPITEDWIISRTGIRTRRVAAKGEFTSDMATVAASRALSKSGINPDKVDMIVLATFTPDRILPSTASIVREKIGAINAMAFDINAACSGFVYALSVADSFIRAGNAQYILVIAAENLTRFITPEDPKNYVLFGDGAGAALVGPGNGINGMIGSHFGMNTQYPVDWLTLPIGSEFAGEDMRHNGNYPYFKMNGPEIFRWAVKTVPVAMKKCTDECDLSFEDIDLIIPHQANRRLIAKVADRLHLPMHKFMMNIERFGNTSAASIPIAFDEAFETDRIHDGDTVMLFGFGAGLAWGGMIVRI